MPISLGYRKPGLGGSGVIGGFTQYQGSEDVDLSDVDNNKD